MLTNKQPAWLRAGLAARQIPETRAAIERQRRYVRHVPIDLRVHAWLFRWIVGPRDLSGVDPQAWFWRLRRFRRWFMGLYPNVRNFVRAIAGPRLPELETSLRNEACEECLFLRIRLPARAAGSIRRYCGACGCPDWPLSELSWKNRLARWICPQRRHKQRAEWADILIANLDREKQDRAERRRQRQADRREHDGDGRNTLAK